MTTFVYSFKKRFAESVENGTKLQTVRAVRKDGRAPKPGDVVSLYTGLRTKHSRPLGRGRVVEVLQVKMIFTGETIESFQIDGREIGFAEGLRFAIDDGFRSEHPLSDMLVFFRLAYGDRFDGHCIRWKPEP